MEPLAAAHALGIIAAHTTTPKGERERATVLQSFAVLSELARLYYEATGSHTDIRRCHP